MRSNSHASFLVVLVVALLSVVLLTPTAAVAGQPAADLDPARNGSAASPISPVDWVNGNAGSSNSHYVEGYSIPYRVVLTNLPVGTSITLTLGYDTKNSGKHAIDYLTSYDRLEPHTPFGHTAESVEPLRGVTGTFSPASTFAIPVPGTAGSLVPGQPAASFNALPSAEKQMTIYNGTITGIAYKTQGDLSAAQAETQISVTFTASDPAVVLAWGGHIGSRLDWGYDASGAARSAGGINGSPYHMRLESWDLNNLGNQDRSLSADAVFMGPKLTVIKQLINDNGGTKAVTDFSFSVNGGTAIQFEADGQNEVEIDSGDYSVTEQQVAGYTISYSADCTGTIDWNETKTCTITNDDKPAHVKLVKQVASDNGGTAKPTDWTLSASGPTPISGAGGAESDVNAGTYTLSESGGPSGYTAGNWSCTAGTLSGNQLTLGPGESATCTITNTAEAKPALTFQKQVSTSSSEGWADSITVAGGTPIYYKFTVTNTGNIALDEVSISESDNKVDVSGCQIATPLGIGASASCVVGPVTAASEAGTYPNTATANGSAGDQAAAPVSDSAQYTVNPPQPPSNPPSEQHEPRLWEPWPTWTPVPTNTPQPTATPVPPTATLVPEVLADVPTIVPPTATPGPTAEPTPEPEMPKSLPSAGLSAEEGQDDGTVTLAIAGLLTAISGWALRRRSR